MSRNKELRKRDGENRTVKQETVTNSVITGVAGEPERLALRNNMVRFIC
jgi:hypothetical protein